MWCDCKAANYLNENMKKIYIKLKRIRQDDNLMNIFPLSQNLDSYFSVILKWLLEREREFI